MEINPLTFWVNYGYEGWKPYEYDSLTEAIKHESYGSEKRITIDVAWEARDKTDIYSS